MLLPVIPSNNLQLLLKFDIQYFQPLDLNIVGYDADPKFKTVFFNRSAIAEIPGIYTLEFPLPMTPKGLLINFSNETNHDDSAYKVLTLKCDKLPQNPTALRQDDIEFIQFAKWFALNAGTLPEGLIKSHDGKFKIRYFNDIVTGPGELTADGRPIKAGIKLSTPARTDHETGDIELARSQVRGFTVPIIMAIIMHERTHYKNNTMDEKFCDREALRIVLGLGFPKTECIYAFTNIFEDTKVNIDRINDIVAYVENYRYAA
jgi:hypothetical protein